MFEAEQLFSEGPMGFEWQHAATQCLGLGVSNFIVRWGNRWIVATDSGLIATP